MKSEGISFQTKSGHPASGRVLDSIEGSPVQTLPEEGHCVLEQDTLFLPLSTVSTHEKDPI